MTHTLDDLDPDNVPDLDALAVNLDDLHTAIATEHATTTTQENQP